MLTSAESVLSYYWDGLLPINPNTMARKCNIKTNILNSAPELSGVAYIDNNGCKTIGYNPTLPVFRIRFIIAHEIGHHLLGHINEKVSFLNDFIESNYHYENPLIEKEADIFAAKLLIPREAVSVLIERRGITEISDLADTLGVSESVMYWRLRDLGFSV